MNQLYSIYDDFIQDQTVCCKKRCDTCCTRNVTLTTLEGYHIVEYINGNHKRDLFDRLKSGLQQKRFIPEVTTNRFAEMVCNGESPPEERSDPAWGPCPLLTGKECPIYPVRPFGCRCLVSRVPCRDNGYAEQDPFVLTVNNIFLQYIEHVDNRGLTGNLTDILLSLDQGEELQKDSTGRLKPDSRKIENSSIKFLMIPPEHRLQVKPVIEAIRRIS